MGKIGFIGLGIMGESMSENIVKKSNEEVWVYDLNSAQVEKLVAVGGHSAKSIADVGEKCDRIFIMVPRSEHVRAVIEELLPVIKEGTILVDMSTIDPSVSKELAAKVKEKNADMVDAPVVKSKPAAIVGELGIYVGGDKESYEKVRDILGYMGKDIIYLGENGAGLVMKICHNMLVAQIQNAVNEMLVLAETAGLNFDDVVTAISYGGGQNFYIDSKKDTLKAKDFSPKFSIENMHKDIHLALNLAKDLEIDLPGAVNASKVYDQAIEEGLNKEDFSATIKVVNEITKQ
ncbi:NAD(P)-dependent oxidoreductase [Tepidibacillus marianensis]|uniref:NAD(P)-dependent oxidoreductase n=1 Tax=Tepidibacillus marianensis TaxID=3131995 RepID=UPI0030CD50AF